MGPAPGRPSGTAAALGGGFRHSLREDGRSVAKAQGFFSSPAYFNYQCCCDDIATPAHITQPAAQCLMTPWDVIDLPNCMHAAVAIGETRAACKPAAQREHPRHALLEAALALRRAEVGLGVLPPRHQEAHHRLPPRVRVPHHHGDHGAAQGLRGVLQLHAAVLRPCVLGGDAGDDAGAAPQAAGDLLEEALVAGELAHVEPRGEPGGLEGVADAPRVAELAARERGDLRPTASSSDSSCIPV